MKDRYPEIEIGSIYKGAFQYRNETLMVLKVSPTRSNWQSRTGPWVDFIVLETGKKLLFKRDSHFVLHVVFGGTELMEKFE